MTLGSGFLIGTLRRGGGRGLYFLKWALLSPYYRYSGPLPPSPLPPQEGPYEFRRFGYSLRLFKDAARLVDLET